MLMTKEENKHLRYISLLFLFFFFYSVLFYPILSRIQLNMKNFALLFGLSLSGSFTKVSNSLTGLVLPYGKNKIKKRSKLVWYRDFSAENRQNQFCRGPPVGLQTGPEKFGLV